MAIRWLDGARYADTNGYQSDGERFMWRWRDWVIDAYNRNLPFDQFTIEQLAGDMLPGCTLDQQIATGFNRNHRGNAEGRDRSRGVRRRVRRRSRRHDVHGLARADDGLRPLPRPQIRPALAEGVLPAVRLFQQRARVRQGGQVRQLAAGGQGADAARRDELRSSSAACRRRRQLRGVVFTTGRRSEASGKSHSPPRSPSIGRSPPALEVQYPLDGDPANHAPAAGPGPLPPKPAATRGELIVSPGKKLVPAEADAHSALARFEGSPGTFVPGKLGQGCTFDGSRFIDAGDVGAFGYYDRFSLAAWINPGDHGGTIVSRMTDAEQADGYYVALADGRVQVNLVKRWLDDALRVETERSLAAGRVAPLLVTYDGSRVASGVKILYRRQIPSR